MSEENRPTNKKNWYAQCFREEWLGKADFKDWLQQKDKDSSYCKCCKTTLKHASKSMFMKHKISVEHKSCYYATKVTVNIDQFMKTKTYNDQTSIGELWFVACFAEHNIPLACVDLVKQYLRRVNLQENYQ